MLVTHVKIYKIIYNVMGINHKAPEQMNVLGKGNLVHYLWVDVAIYEMYFRYPNLNVIYNKSR